jgi:hypothetical protein
MEARPKGRSEFTEEQQAGLLVRTADQDRTLAAVHRLEAALAKAAPGRQGAWWHEVTAALEDLDAATAEEQDNAERPDSLLSDIKRTQPRLRTRVRGVRAQYVQLRQALGSLREEFGTDGPDVPDSPDVPDVSEVRQRLAWLLTALRYQRARESDLIYEAYFDAFNADLARETS